MSQKKKSLNEKLRISIPEPLTSEPHIEILGNREMVIDGCRGVVEYGENLIKLNTVNVVISLVGMDLLIKSFDSGVAIITGQISEITFVS